jgi:hypothetical protein
LDGWLNEWITFEINQNVWLPLWSFSLDRNVFVKIEIYFQCNNSLWNWFVESLTCGHCTCSGTRIFFWTVKKILDWKKSFQPPSWIFWKTFFHKMCVLLTPNECKKKIGKMLDTLRVTSKNLILIRHFGSNLHFWIIWQKMRLIHVADKNTNAL